MRAFRRWMLVLAAVAVTAAPARAADETDDSLVPREEAIELMLLRQKSVQEDLGVTADQAKKIHEFAAGQWKKFQGLREKSRAERHQAFEKLGKENARFIHDTLKPEQRKRLFQIAMQKAGLLFVTDPRVASKLKLTDAQKKQARQLHEEAHKEAHKFLSAKDPHTRMDEMKKLHAANRKRLTTLLTDEQKMKWKELVGKKFTGELHFGPAKSSKE